ncbi:MAG: MerR family transcriptional regulator [Desulfobacterales bacterium]|nr:MerR family transcriptional regulator [Desulfobacterales bacterium]
MAAPPEHPPAIPDKLYFRIGEVSRLARVPSSVLRFWESEFPRIRPKRTDAGQKRHRPHPRPKPCANGFCPNSKPFGICWNS